MKERSCSETAYYHDQKGTSHDPGERTVREYSAAWARKQHEDYMEQRKNVSEEVERLQNVLHVIEDDPKGLAMLATLLDSCADYTNLVIGHLVAKKLNGKVDTEVFQMNLEDADRHRRLKHNALMADLKAFRLYVLNHYGPNGDRKPHDDKTLPATVLYTGTSTHRTAIGKWAMRMTDALAKMDEQELDMLRSSDRTEAEAAE